MLSLKFKCKILNLVEFFKRGCRKCDKTGGKKIWCPYIPIIKKPKQFGKDRNV